MGISKLLRTIRPRLNSRRNENVRQSPCGDPIPHSHGHIRSPFRLSVVTEHLDTFLDAKTIHINFDEYVKQNRIPASCPIYRVHASQLAANNPIEDSWNCGFIQTNDKILKFVFSVIDGHSGSSCSHALAWIVLEYIAATLLSPEDLTAVLNNLETPFLDDELPHWIVENPSLYNNKGKNVTRRCLSSRLPPRDVRKFLIDKLVNFIQDLRRSPVPDNQYWEEALMRLDNDLCSIGLGDIESPSQTTENPFASTTLTPPFLTKMLRVAQSGAVGIFGLLDWSTTTAKGVELQIANVGDCSAVLFSTSDDSDELKAQRLSTPHNGYTNPNELSRLMLEHPEHKPEELINNGGRLLGELAPTRAFGDVRYKWTRERLLQMATYFGAATESSEKMTSASWAGVGALPVPYTSPPYLTAKPEVTTCVLKPSDRYLVLATDGLWDTISPERAASLLSRLQPGQCPATRLMRAALSVPLNVVSTNSRGVVKEDPRLASALLSLPPGAARLYRDDITILVVELNTPSA